MRLNMKDKWGRSTNNTNKEGSYKHKNYIKIARKACKKVLEFFISTIGLLLLNGLVMVIGAFIFEHLEVSNERQECINARKDYNKAEEATVRLLMDMSTRLDDVGPLSDVERSEVVSELVSYLESFALSVYDTQYNVSTNCEDMGTPEGQELKWSFAGSFLFAVTVVTTIGYGHIAPVTMWGRLVCIAYALIGIPVFMLALANIGEVMANLFKAVYAVICCCTCCQKKTNDEETINDTARRDIDDIRETALFWQLDLETGKPIQSKDVDVVMEELSEDENNCDENDEDLLTVPLSLTVFIYCVFLTFGAVTFTILEQDWNFMESFYFSTITATTIGFGDMIPNTKLDKGAGIVKTVYIILYITFSMAAISMCFQLIADEIVMKLEWISQQFGNKSWEVNNGSDQPDNDGT